MLYFSECTEITVNQFKNFFFSSVSQLFLSEDRNKVAYYRAHHSKARIMITYTDHERKVFSTKNSTEVFRLAIHGDWGMILYAWCNFKSWKFGMVFILVVKITLVCLHAATYFSIINTNRYRKSRTDNLVGFRGKKCKRKVTFLLPELIFAFLGFPELK